MITHKFFQLLIEAEISDPNVQAYFDRLMLRLFESPPLLASFVNAVIFPMKNEEVIIQLEFHQIPKEFHIDLVKIAGAKDVKVTTYKKGSTTCTGLQVRLKTEDITPKPDVQDGPLDGGTKTQDEREGSLALSTGFR